MYLLSYLIISLMAALGSNEAPIMETYNAKQTIEKHSVFICSAEFHDPRYNKAHAGSGFFISYKGKVYGVTAKHVLYFAKTESMNAVDFNGELKSWEFVSPADSSVKIRAGNLLNENSEELLSGPIKGDWLIFKIEDELPANIHVFEVSEGEPEQAEKLSFTGYPYESKDPSKPLTVKGSYEGSEEEWVFKMKVSKGNYGGMSGGPVTNSKGQIVGLVSMGYFNEEAQRMVFQPASVHYFKEVIARRNSKWEKPAFMEFGTTLAEIKEYLKAKEYSYEQKSIDPIELPTAKESQIQLDVQGIPYGGKERFVELIFADEVLEMAWILTEAEEEEIIKAHFAEVFGKPTHVLPGAWFHLNDGVGLRNEPHEVAFISDRLKEPYRMWFVSMGAGE